MSIEDATFVVQRDRSKQWSCQGKNLKDKLRLDDMMVVQKGDTRYSIKGLDLLDVYLELEAPKMRVKVKKAGSSPNWSCRYTDVYINNVKQTTPANNQFTVVKDGDILTLKMDPTKQLYFGNNSWDMEIIEADLHGRPNGLKQFFENFYGFTGEGILNCDVSDLENFEAAFKGCSNFNVDVSDWRVKNATNMTEMFRNCNSMVQDLSSWCVPNVTENLLFAGSGVTDPVWGTCPKEPTRPDPNKPPYFIDDALFIVTDGDNGHKSVTGAQIQGMFKAPDWEKNNHGIANLRQMRVFNNRLMALTTTGMYYSENDGDSYSKVTNLTFEKAFEFSDSPEINWVYVLARRNGGNTTDGKYWTNAFGTGYYSIDSGPDATSVAVRRPKAGSTSNPVYRIKVNTEGMWYDQTQPRDDEKPWTASSDWNNKITPSSGSAKGDFMVENLNGNFVSVCTKPQLYDQCPIMYSDTGRYWTKQTSDESIVKDCRARGMAYLHGKYIIIGANKVQNNQLLLSDDLKVWQGVKCPLPTSDTPISVVDAYDGQKILIMTKSGSDWVYDLATGNSETYPHNRNHGDYSWCTSKSSYAFAGDNTRFYKTQLPLGGS